MNVADFIGSFRCLLNNVRLIVSTQIGADVNNADFRRLLKTVFTPHYSPTYFSATSQKFLKKISISVLVESALDISQRMTS